MAMTESNRKIPSQSKVEVFHNYLPLTLSSMVTLHIHSLRRIFSLFPDYLPILMKNLQLHGLDFKVITL